MNLNLQRIRFRTTLRNCAWNSTQLPRDSFLHIKFTIGAKNALMVELDDGATLIGVGAIIAHQAINLSTFRSAIPEAPGDSSGVNPAVIVLGNMSDAYVVPGVEVLVPYDGVTMLVAIAGDVSYSVQCSAIMGVVELDISVEIPSRVFKRSTTSFPVEGIASSEEISPGIHHAILESLEDTRNFCKGQVTRVQLHSVLFIHQIFNPRFLCTTIVSMSCGASAGWLNDFRKT